MNLSSKTGKLVFIISQMERQKQITAEQKQLLLQQIIEDPVRIFEELDIVKADDLSQDLQQKQQKILQFLNGKKAQSEAQSQTKAPFMKSMYQVTDQSKTAPDHQTVNSTQRMDEEQLFNKYFNADNKNSMYQSIKRPVKEKLHQIKKKMRKCLNLLQQVSLIEVDLKKLSEFTKDLLYSLLDISDFQISKVTDKSIYMFSSTVNKIDTYENNQKIMDNLNQFQINKLYIIDEQVKKMLPICFTSYQSAKLVDVMQKVTLNQSNYYLLYKINLPEAKCYLSNLIRQGFEKELMGIFQYIIDLLIIFIEKDYKISRANYILNFMNIINEYFLNSQIFFFELARGVLKEQVLKEVVLVNFPEIKKKKKKKQRQEENSGSEPYDKIYICHVCYQISPRGKFNLDYNMTLKFFEQVLYQMRNKLVGKANLQSYSMQQRIEFLQNPQQQILLEFSAKGQLQFISQNLDEKIKNVYKMTFDSDSKDYSIENIFINNQQIVDQINKIRTNQAQQIVQNNCCPEYLIVGSKQINKNKVSINFYMHDYQNCIESQPDIIQIQSPTESKSDAYLSGKAKIKKIMTKMKFIFLSMHSVQVKDMIMKDKAYSNSQVLEWLPEKDKLKVLSLNNNLRPQCKSQFTQDEIEKEIDEGKQKDMEQFKKASENKIKQDIIITDHLYINEKKDTMFDKTEINIFDETDNEKLRFAYAILEKKQYISKFKIPMRELYAFLVKVQYHYNKRKNPFHNFDHALTVQSVCYKLSFKKKICALYSDLDLFALIFSGLCHDIDHRGRTNAFEINTRSKLSLRYNDKSVLEQHHIAKTFKILRSDETNVLKNFSIKEYQDIRKLMINNILATDNQQHFTICKDFEVKLKVWKDQPLEQINDADKLLISGIMMHAADFGGSVSSFAISEQWSNKVNEEFKTQYELEGKLGIPQTPYFKDLDNMMVKSKGEIGFIKAISQPIWVILNEFLEGDLKTECDSIAQNIHKWEQRYKKIMEQK